jgi:3-methyladenine DNA glycosylase/8-oxoguanine DNA glycosylase
MTRSAHIELEPFDLHATFDHQLVGRFDPTGSRTPTSVEKLQRTAAGDVIVWRFSRTASGLLIEVRGDDGGLFDAFLRQFPLDDGIDAFRPAHPLLDTLQRRYSGLRLLRFPWVFDSAAATVLQQRVRWQAGYTDFRRIALRWGTRTAEGVAFPTSRQIAAVAPAQIEALGIDPKRARALWLLAQADARHDFLCIDADTARACARLLSIRGIGPWTAGRVAGLAFGNADAVIIGDLHIPSLVTMALAGEGEGTDARMLELLAPYAGHRFRVQRLLMWAGRRAAGMSPAPVRVSALA